MCGFFAGIFERDAAPDDRMVAAALASIAHRGPDGSGIERIDLPDGRVALLGHVRLAMVGVGDGRQPFVTDRTALVANGEIYEHARARADLRAGGARFATASDSEVALHLAEAAGPAPGPWLSRLRGEWAVAWVDRLSGTLHAACDPSGTRPLRHHVSADGRIAVVASEAKALFALGVPRALDEGALRLSLAFQYLPSGATLFRDVGMLPPGCAFSARGRASSVRPWHDPFAPTDPSDWHVDPEEAGRLSRAMASGRGPRRSEAVLGALRDAVAIRVPDEVSCGTHLSGGLDSAAILALVQETSGRRGVDAFCAAFPWGDDEIPEARATATALGANLVPVEMPLRRLLDAMDLAPLHAEGMCMNAHAGAKLLIAEAVRDRGHKCVLTGEGADEAFFGYEHLRADFPLADRPITDDLNAATLGVHRPDGPTEDLSSLVRALGDSPVPTFLAAKSSAAAALGPTLGPRMACAAPDHARIVTTLPSEWRASMSRLAPPEAARGLWSVLALSGYILRGLDDAMGMARAVESRIAFLDPLVVGLASTVPASAHYGPDGIEKGILRESLAGILPDAVLRRPKRPFMAPALTSTAEGAAWARERLLDGPLAPSGLFDRKGLEALLASPDRPLREACLLRLSSLSTFLSTFELA